MSEPNDIAQALAWMQDCGRLDTLLAPLLPMKPDKWQPYEGTIVEPVVDPPEGYIPIGPWKPIGTWTASEQIQIGDNTQRIYFGLVWRRPLKKIVSSG